MTDYRLPTAAIDSVIYLDNRIANLIFRVSIGPFNCQDENKELVSVEVHPSLCNIIKAFNQLGQTKAHFKTLSDVIVCKAKVR